MVWRLGFLLVLSQLRGISQGRTSLPPSLMFRGPSLVLRPLRSWQARRTFCVVNNSDVVSHPLPTVNWGRGVEFEFFPFPFCGEGGNGTRAPPPPAIAGVWVLGDLKVPVLGATFLSSLSRARLFSSQRFRGNFEPRAVPLSSDSRGWCTDLCIASVVQ